MSSWPDIAKPSSLIETTSKAQIKSDFEAGYVQSMPKWTRARKVFELGWKAMSSADKSTLEAFFENNIGSTFDWTHPLDDSTYTVRFTDDNLECTYVPVGHWQITLTLEEQ